MIEALEHRTTLDPAARVALKALAIDVRTLAAGTYLVREGGTPIRCGFLIEGYAFRQKFAISGNRALVSLQVPGDFLDLQNLYLQESDHDVQTLTHCIVAEFAIADLRSLVDLHPEINRGFWMKTLIEASIVREWLLNIGRRSAAARVAHLLCEIAVRVDATDAHGDRRYVLPMTQEQLGDALGLTAVHINRVLGKLEHDGLILRRRREVTIVDVATLRHAADFDTRYLHLGARVDAAPVRQA